MPYTKTKLRGSMNGTTRPTRSPQVSRAKQAVRGIKNVVKRVTRRTK